MNSPGIQISTGMVVAAFKPHSPAIVPNPQNAIQGIVSSKSTYVFGAPTFVEVNYIIPEIGKFRTKQC